MLKPVSVISTHKCNIKYYIYTAPPAQPLHNPPSSPIASQTGITNPDIIKEATQPVVEDDSQKEDCECLLNSTENQ